MVEPGKHPKVVMRKDDLDSWQKAVSICSDYQGLIEFVSLGNDDCLMCNEEGKLIGLERNRRLGRDRLVSERLSNETNEFVIIAHRVVAARSMSSRMVR